MLGATRGKKTNTEKETVVRIVVMVLLTTLTYVGSTLYSTPIMDMKDSQMFVQNGNFSNQNFK